MELNILHDKKLIYNFLAKNPELQIYCIGDLDDFFWPKTIWYALTDKDKIQSIALLYCGMETPTLLSFCKDNSEAHIILMNRIKPLLPRKFYAHLSPGLLDVFGSDNVIEYYGLNYKMALKKIPKIITDQSIKTLSSSDHSHITDFYQTAYPNNWFDKRMLETGKYFGYYAENKLIGVAGIHVYSAEYKVAALGNIAVHPEFRGIQIAYKLTSALCSDLFKSVDYIGLNVKSDNVYAIRSYQKIGFEIIGMYDECLISNK